MTSTGLYWCCYESKTAFSLYVGNTVLFVWVLYALAEDPLKQEIKSIAAYIIRSTSWDAKTKSKPLLWSSQRR